MKLLKQTGIGLIILLFSIELYADSPITETEFFRAYYEIPEIIKASKEGVLNNEFANYLSFPNNSIEKKVALINALGWSKNFKNKLLYEIYLNKKYKTKEINFSIITPDEHLCLGYLAIMDNIENTSESILILKKAYKRNPQSYTFNIIYGLALCQFAFQNCTEILDEFVQGSDLVDTKFINNRLTGWCNIYLIPAKIEGNKTLKQDFRILAKKIIFSYFNKYKDNCELEDLVLVPSTDHLNYQTESKIKLKKQGGIYKVPVKINGSLTFDFIFDSGASDVTISDDIFSILVKQGKIDKSDILGYKEYTLADGSTVQQISLILRKIQVGEFIVNNVIASVGNTDSPLLLGQSFLQKFRKFSIDNETGFLEIEPKSFIEE